MSLSSELYPSLRGERILGVRKCGPLLYLVARAQLAAVIFHHSFGDADGHKPNHTVIKILTRSCRDNGLAAFSS